MKLKLAINDREEEWLERLVEVLSEIESKASLDILLLLAKKDLNIVRVMALDSIYHLLKKNNYELEESKMIELKQALSTIKSPSIIEEHVISLFKKLDF